MALYVSAINYNVIDKHNRRPMQRKRQGTLKLGCWCCASSVIKQKNASKLYNNKFS